MPNEYESDRAAPIHPAGARSWLVTASWAQRKRMLRIEAWIFVIASYVLILFAYLCPQDFRSESTSYVAVAWTAFMVSTFLYHFGLVLLFIALVAAWSKAWRLLFVTLPLLCVTVLPSWRNYLPITAPTAQGEILTIMSVNLLMINEQTQPIIDEIRSADPQVLLLQEYTAHWHEALQTAFGDRYPHITYVPRSDSFGAAVYSQRPFVGEVENYLPLTGALDPQMRGVIEVEGQPVAFYNVHLLPPWGMDYTIETRQQFADLRDLLAAESLPFVLAGDFNFTELSPQADELGDLGIADSLTLGGWGRGTTWPVHSFFRWGFPSIRLDHIYLGPGMTCASVRTGEGIGSDHRPIIAEIGLRDAD
jgi:endonuclease/exonuclease/phosphatase (EEP) superfamily protein YafD